MLDHLTGEKITFFLTASNLEAPIEARKFAIEQLLKNAIPKPARDELLIIFNEICPDEAIEYRKDAA